MCRSFPTRRRANPCYNLRECAVDTLPSHCTLDPTQPLPILHPFVPVALLVLLVFWLLNAFYMVFHPPPLPLALLDSSSGHQFPQITFPLVTTSLARLNSLMKYILGSYRLPATSRPTVVNGKRASGRACLMHVFRPVVSELNPKSSVVCLVDLLYKSK